MPKLDEVLKRTRKLAADARKLAAFDGHSSPPDWRPFVAELADELVNVIEILADVDNNDDGVIRREAAAALLGVSVATLHRMVLDGRVRSVQVLGKTRFRVDDVRALREPPVTKKKLRR